MPSVAVLTLAHGIRGPIGHGKSVAAPIKFGAVAEADPETDLPPTVGAFVPEPGSITAASPLQFDVLDESGDLLHVDISAAFAGSDVRETVHDAVGFAANYRGSTKVAISGGVRFILRRAGGWPEGQLSLRIVAIDAAGKASVLL